MKRCWIVIVLCLVPLAALFARESADGHHLHSEWKAYERVQGNGAPDKADIATSGVYMGYVRGICDTLTNVDALSGVSRPFEIPPAVSMAKVYAVVGKYLDDHPELWSSPAIWLVMQALENAYPRAPG